MLRAVLGVALGAALLATAGPALEDAKTTRTERLVERELAELDAAIAGLVDEDEPGARRIVSLSLPGESPTAAPLAYVALGGAPGETARETTRTDVVAYRVAGGRERVRRVSTDLGLAGDGTDPAGEALVLPGGGTYRVRLRLLESGGNPTVAVTVRGFKSEDGPTPEHARPAGAVPRA